MEKKQKGKNDKKGGVPVLSEPIPASVYAKGGNFYISIHAKPNSKISQIQEITDEALEMNIAAPPRDGEANSELIDFFCQALNVKKSSLSLDRGGKSRNKLLEISDSGYSDLNELYEALKANIRE